MLDRTTYFIHEHVGMFKLADVYDIIDPATQQKIGEARENVSLPMYLLRMFVNKQLLPTSVNVYEEDESAGQRHVFSIRRGMAILRYRVDVVDAEGTLVGYFKSKALSLGGAFRVFTADDHEIALVKGDWKGWNFRFLSGDQELGVISKKWGGLGKEFFTSADSYVINIHGEPSPAVNLLFLAAGLAIDTVYKERG